MTRRVQGGQEFYFLLNHGNQSQIVTLREDYYDLLEQAELRGTFILEPHEYKILSKTTE